MTRASRAPISWDCRAAGPKQVLVRGYRTSARIARCASRSSECQRALSRAPLNPLSDSQTTSRPSHRLTRRLYPIRTYRRLHFGTGHPLTGKTACAGSNLSGAPLKLGAEGQGTHCLPFEPPQKERPTPCAIRARPLRRTILFPAMTVSHKRFGRDAQGIVGPLRSQVRNDPTAESLLQAGARTGQTSPTATLLRGQEHADFQRTRKSQNDI